MVEHSMDRKKFYLKSGDEESFVKYENKDSGEMDIVETFVPHTERGKGVASQLATAALDYAEQEGRKVIASCSYIESFINRNSKYAHLRDGS